ncbi:hypothetical protein ACOSQ3_010477 [Xanthoceras sorbifolium]
MGDNQIGFSGVHPIPTPLWNEYQNYPQYQYYAQNGPPPMYQNPFGAGAPPPVPPQQQGYQYPPWQLNQYPQPTQNVPHQVHLHYPQQYQPPMAEQGHLQNLEAQIHTLTQNLARVIGMMETGRRTDSEEALSRTTPRAYDDEPPRILGLTRSREECDDY